jgi:hypothetical protein
VTKPLSRKEIRERWLRATALKAEGKPVKYIAAKLGISRRRAFDVLAGGDPDLKVHKRLGRPVKEKKCPGCPGKKSGSGGSGRRP